MNCNVSMLNCLPKIKTTQANTEPFLALSKLMTEKSFWKHNVFIVFSEYKIQNNIKSIMFSCHWGLKNKIPVYTSQIHRAAVVNNSVPVILNDNLFSDKLMHSWTRTCTCKAISTIQGDCFVMKKLKFSVLITSLYSCEIKKK